MVDSVFCSANSEFSSACTYLNSLNYTFPFNSAAISTKYFFEQVQRSITGKFTTYDPDFFAEGWKSTYTPTEWDLSAIDRPWNLLYKEDRECPRSLNEPVFDQIPTAEATTTLLERIPSTETIGANTDRYYNALLSLLDRAGESC